jgi:hypothetical protein
MRSLGSWRTGFHEKAFLDLLRAAVKGQSDSRRPVGASRCAAAWMGCPPCQYRPPLSGQERTGKDGIPVDFRPPSVKLKPTVGNKQYVNTYL